MKKLLLLATGVVVAVAFSAPAHALPAFKTEFQELYNVKEPSTDAQKSLAEAIDGLKSSCNVCHYGKSKKNRNDYGMALSKDLKKSVFTKDFLKAEPEKAKQLIITGLKNGEAAKSKGGSTFGELIESGKLPGTAPEGETQ